MCCCLHKFKKNVCYHFYYCFTPMQTEILSLQKTVHQTKTIVGATEKFREFKQTNKSIHLSCYPMFLFMTQTFYASLHLVINNFISLEETTSPPEIPRVFGCTLYLQLCRAMIKMFDHSVCVCVCVCVCVHA